LDSTHRWACRSCSSATGIEPVGEKSASGSCVDHTRRGYEARPPSANRYSAWPPRLAWRYARGVGSHGRMRTAPDDVEAVRDSPQSSSLVCRYLGSLLLKILFMIAAPERITGRRSWRQTRSLGRVDRCPTQPAVPPGPLSQVGLNRH